ncbi:hypothetical protein Pmi06nite_32750 [Planotetraspora mira]|uniref:Uncharacterized protein n=1 Tax=Planotetraspora mira TaxID=58121 RepID=A0A8J3TNX5_9ACTN|nr:hypothetical protein Pmi06nite_32750 [Planotetraspora mira]
MRDLLLDEGAQIDRPLLLRRVGPELREQKQVGDDHLEPVDVGQGPPEHVGHLGLVRMQLSLLEFCPQSGEGRAQLVRGVRRELTLPQQRALGRALGLLDSCQRAVHRPGQAADLVVAHGLLDPAADMPDIDGGEFGADVLDRPEGAACDLPGAPAGEQDEDDDLRREDPVERPGGRHAGHGPARVDHG